MPGAGRDDEDRGVVEERAGDQFLDLEANDVEHTLVRQIGLGENDEPCRDAQQAADLEVLARLRHHRLIGGHMQHDEVHTPDTGEHVANEALMAGTSTKERTASCSVVWAKPRSIVMRALFFLAQTIGIRAGQREDQRALAVIDVAGGAHDDVLHQIKEP